MGFREEIAGVQLALRAALAATLSLAIAQHLGLHHPIYAFIAAVIVTDLSSKLSRRLGLIRIAATIIGASVGASLSPALGTGPIGLGLGVLSAMLACRLLRLAEGAKVAGYICGLILLEHRGEAWIHAVDRLGETVLGVVVAWVVSALPLLLRFDPDKPET